MGIECPPNIKDVAHNLEFKAARGEKNDALGRRQPPRGRESYLVPESRHMRMRDTHMAGFRHFRTHLTRIRHPHTHMARIRHQGTRARIWLKSGTGPSERVGRPPHKSAPGVRGRPGRERTCELLGGYATCGLALSEKSASTRHTAMQP